MGPNWDTS